MILILGGTTEAAALARLLAEQRPDVSALVSLAGRTRAPAALPLPTRTGGFGGTRGLAGFLREHRVTAVVDATHPFAATMAANAVEACHEAGVPLLVLTRPAWLPGPDDRWAEVANAETAAAALGREPRRVFLTAGRLELPAFLAAPHHHYLIRSIDPPDALPPHATLILARGPFAQAEERELLIRHHIEVLVTKNSGGDATRAKLDAARVEGLSVILIRRPNGSDAPTRHSAEAALCWLEGLDQGSPPKGAIQDRGV